MIVITNSYVIILSFLIILALICKLVSFNDFGNFVIICYLGSLTPFLVPVAIPFSSHTHSAGFTHMIYNITYKASVITVS